VGHSEDTTKSDSFPIVTPEGSTVATPIGVATMVRERRMPWVQLKPGMVDTGKQLQVDHCGTRHWQPPAALARRSRRRRRTRGRSSLKFNQAVAVTVALYSGAVSDRGYQVAVPGSTRRRRRPAGDSSDGPESSGSYRSSDGCCSPTLQKGSTLNPPFYRLAGDKIDGKVPPVSDETLNPHPIPCLHFLEQFETTVQ